MGCGDSCLSGGLVFSMERIGAQMNECLCSGELELHTKKMRISGSGAMERPATIFPSHQAGF